MTNLPLTQLYRFIIGQEQRGSRRDLPPLPDFPDQRASAGIFLVLRRMRIPLVVLIVMFAVSVLGLSLIPGQDPQGRVDRMSIFEAFYFMSYTATTIGFGELPHTFTPTQRMWVTFSIFLSVVGWAYAVGTLLALMQDRAFRRALARRRFARQVARIPEPFLVVVGYGNASRRLARSLDNMARRFVVLDRDEDRVAAVSLDSYRADTPALVADARDTGNLVLAGLGSRHCEAVVALAADEDTNLDVAMTTALLRPDVRVLARTNSREVAERMRAFGAPEVINPLDRFGDHLRILVRSPAAYQLMVWLTSAPGTALPRRREPLPRGRWVVCGSGRFGQELTRDLCAEGLDVSIAHGERGSGGEHVVAGSLASADVAHASAVVAATEDDMMNLWLVEEARRVNPDAFVAALQNRAANVPLFTALGVDFGLQPSQVVAHEVMARIAHPVLMTFLAQVPRQGDAWAAEQVDRLVARCGRGTPDLWLVRLDEAKAPAVKQRLSSGGLRLGDLFRDPNGREHPVEAVSLALLRDGEGMLAPCDEEALQDGDVLLVAGRDTGRRALDATLTDEPTAAYVLDGRFVPSGWLWRRLTGTPGR